jgi:hypothetical protein
VRDAQGDVLPAAVAAGKSASKYMLKIISGLKSNITDEAMANAVQTLAMLLKVWQKTQYENALTIVRKCKLSWAAVLHRGAPTRVLKGKKGKPDQTVVRSPPKPSRSPWLSQAERSELGNLFKDDWSSVEKIRSEFVALSAEQQHRQFFGFIRRVKQHYEDLNNISNSVHAKLGKRKQWIEAFCKADGYKPKPKRDESESFLLSTHFFSKDHSTMNMTVKKVFAPVTYLTLERERWTSTITTWGNLVSTDESNLIVNSSTFDRDDEGDVYKLWIIWAETFKPIFHKNGTAVEEAQPPKDQNLFSRLLGLTTKE